MSEVKFIRVTDRQSKLGRLVGVIQEHYARGDKVLVHVPDDAAANFVDDLLWRFPRDGFLPHVVSHQPTEERVAITTNERNLNHATVLVHLAPKASQMVSRFQTVYDLRDETSPSKAAQSDKRAQTYVGLGMEVETI